MLPNILTVLRMFLSIVLLFTKPLTTLFFIFYTLSGISDVLDGYIARKMNLASKTGALLDSIADMLFICSIILIFLPFFKWKLWMIIWLIIIAFIRVSSMLIGFIKYHSLVLLHTYFNKAAGLILFCFPFIYNVFNFNITVFCLCIATTISALEECIINILSKKLNRDVKSILHLLIIKIQ